MSATDLENTLYLDVPAGRVVIELRPDLAPGHVARIKELARARLLRRHRLPPRHRRLHGADRRPARRRHRRLRQEAQGRVQHRQACPRHRLDGALANAPTAPTASSSSVSTPAPFLDGKYTVWGQVTSGMEHIDAIKKGDEDDNGAVDDPDKIVRLQVAADVKGEVDDEATIRAPSRSALSPGRGPVRGRQRSTVPNV